MTGNREHSGKGRRSAQGFSLLEVMTVAAILGILATFAFPSVRRMLNQQEAKASATQVAGLLNDARTRAMSEGTPHLVYFNAPEVGADGECGAMAVEVRDADHSYSITAGDQQTEFKLPVSACDKVKQYGADTAATPTIAVVPMPNEDLAARAPDAASLGIVPAVADAAASTVGGVGSAVSGAVSGLTGTITGGGGSSGSSSPNSGPGKGGAVSTVATTTANVMRSATVDQTVVNGATFPVDPNDGRPVVAFSERGVPVDPAHPTQWGSGAGGVYLTDGESTVVAALVAPLGDIQLRVFDPGSGSWK